MIMGHVLRVSHVVTGIALLAAAAGECVGQTIRGTIPIAVAQAMAFEPEFLGKPQFFSGRTPPGWPAALTPSGVKILGGGVIGESPLWRVRVAVFEFPTGSHPGSILAAAVRHAGFVNPAFEPGYLTKGGFIDTGIHATRFCNDHLALASFAPLDSTNAARIYTVQVGEGEGVQANCRKPQEDPYSVHFPVTVPVLLPPPGAYLIPGGSGSSGSTGQMSAALRTTMPTDSILEHYTAQLVKAGWKTVGRAANADGASIRRFSLFEGTEPWTAALIVMATGDQRQLLLHVAKSQ